MAVIASNVPTPENRFDRASASLQRGVEYASTIMTGPDPAFITSQNWADISDLLMMLWLILGSAMGLGGSMLLAHGMIPSLVNTRDLPADLGKKARPPLYAAGATFLALGLFSVYLFVDRFSVISGIFDHGAQ